MTANPMRTPLIMARVREFVAADGRPGKPANTEIVALLLREFQLFVTPGQVSGALFREKIDRGGINVVTVWTPERVARLRELMEGSSTWPEIGRDLGVSFDAARHKAEDMGWRRAEIRTRANTMPLASVLEAPPAPPPPVTRPNTARETQRRATLASAVARSPVVVTTLASLPAAYRPMPINFRAPYPIPASAPSTPCYGRVIECCWPLGEKPPFRSCDAPSDPGRPYCEDHAKIAYVRVRDRREDGI